MTVFLQVLPVTNQTFEQIVVLLQFVAGAGAGYFASILFDWIRTQVPLNGTGIGTTIVHTPRYARFFVLTLTFTIGTAAAVAVAYLTAGEPGKVLDAAVAGFLGQLFAQLRHALTSLPTTVPDEYVLVLEDQPNGDPKLN